jgi:hypothetical protein
LNSVARQRRTNARRIARVIHLPAHAAQATVHPLPSARRLRSVAAQDRADAVSGSPVAIDLLADESDQRVSVSLAGQPVHGRVVLSDDSTAVYTSAPGFTGTDTFAYRLTDADNHVSRVTVTVSVSPDTEPASACAALAYAA